MFGSWGCLGLGFAVTIAGSIGIVVGCSVLTSVGPVEVARMLLASPFVLSPFGMSSSLTSSVVSTFSRWQTIMSGWGISWLDA